MSSILTNNGAMVALQTMKSINKNLGMIQSEISTGKAVSSAKDNAAVWAISKVMESDVKGFKGISDSLALGSSTVAVGRKAAETVTNLLTEIKGKIVAAQESNVDRAKIQTDITALKDQITSVVGAAQFNGLNLVDSFRSEEVLSSLDRSGTGVTASRIGVNAQDLSLRQQTVGTTAARADQATITGPAALAVASNTVAGADITIAGPATAAGTGTFDIAIGSTSVRLEVAYDNTEAATSIASKVRAAFEQSTVLKDLGVRMGGTGAALELRLTGESRVLGATVTGSGVANGVTFPASTTVAAAATTVAIGSGTIQNGDSFNVTFGGEQFNYVANERDDRAAVMAGLAKAINDSGAFFARVNPDTTNIQIAQSGTAAVTVGTSARTQGGIAGGGLSDLADLSVTDFSKERGGADGNTLFSALTDSEKEVVTKRALNDALTSIESMIQTAVSGAAEFGSVQKRIEIQSDFVSELSDSLKSGIGSMIDADMEEASARLQALQVQQQLGVQALSIANQQPQSLLSLFR